MALYDALAADYDRFVDWPARLTHELPFLERLFHEHGVRRVLDAACGTGRHALALAARGYEAAGADSSLPMVERARAAAEAEGRDVPFVAAGLGELAPAFPSEFDAILCLGNSLPHLLTPEAERAALADFHELLRPGGLVVIQNRNYDAVWPRRERFMPLQSHREGEREWLFFRFMDFHEATLTFNLVTLQRTGDAWRYRVGATELRPIFQKDLAEALHSAGLGAARFYGAYDGSPFDPEASGDLIAVAERG
ncbi:MAG TPA: methyltransferase domain-containing protein [Anaerolineae bacterium]|mgnify:CR=1 FL=1|nr:methyltransferase domain-containing protein [Anaerolineae bacterium]HOG45580.1 methyltransferase domain-containing protein [Anaerolineae bacterium]HOQ98933.1 methyltransferase domain-containing protein [Anaerolineae bacterium]HPL26529.1 methyltransferase domain-containing protein [Anaerolineae bacterium]